MPDPPSRAGRAPASGRAAAGLVALLPVLLFAAAPAFAQTRIRLVATGGTIANHPGGRLPAAALAAGLDDLAPRVRVDPEEFANAASLTLSLDDWLRLARRLNAAAAEAGVDGLVVTSGTDTLEELAWFLTLTVRTERPVVVTGAMRRPGSADADGPGNLRDAVLVAASPDAGGRGVLVVFQGQIHSARDVVKAQTSGAEAFASGPEGPVGRVTEGDVRFARGTNGRHTHRSEFDVETLRELPRVDVLLTYQDADGDLIAAAVRQRARGIVVAGAGAGAMTASQHAAVRRALERGLPVVISSRVADHEVAALDVAPPGRGLVTGGTLSPVKARLLLMLALASGRSPEAIRRIFAEY